MHKLGVYMAPPEKILPDRKTFTIDKEWQGKRSPVATQKPEIFASLVSMQLLPAYPIRLY